MCEIGGTVMHVYTHRKSIGALHICFTFGCSYIRNNWLEQSLHTLEPAIASFSERLPHPQRLMYRTINDSQATI